MIAFCACAASSSTRRGETNSATRTRTQTNISVEATHLKHFLQQLKGSCLGSVFGAVAPQLHCLAKAPTITSIVAKYAKACLHAHAHAQGNTRANANTLRGRFHTRARTQENTMERATHMRTHSETRSKSLRQACLRWKRPIPGSNLHIGLPKTRASSTPNHTTTTPLPPPTATIRAPIAGPLRAC